MYGGRAQKAVFYINYTSGAPRTSYFFLAGNSPGGETFSPVWVPPQRGVSIPFFPETPPQKIWCSPRPGRYPLNYPPWGPPSFFFPVLIWPEPLSPEFLYTPGFMKISAMNRPAGAKRWPRKRPHRGLPKGPPGIPRGFPPG